MTSRRRLPTPLDDIPALTPAMSDLLGRLVTRPVRTHQGIGTTATGLVTRGLAERRTTGWRDRGTVVVTDLGRRYHEGRR